MNLILRVLIGAALLGCLASVGSAQVLPTAEPAPNANPSESKPKPPPSAPKSDPNAKAKQAPAPKNASPADPDAPTAPPPNGAVAVGRAAQEAKLLNAPKPVYPPLARSARVQGVCRFNVLIDEKGTVSSVQLVRGHPLLVNAAKEAVLQYRYNKTAIGGVDTKVWTIVDVNFSLAK